MEMFTNLNKKFPCPLKTLVSSELPVTFTFLITSTCNTCAAESLHTG